MKLALIIDDYFPFSTRVGAKMLHELALELVINGHDVTVITPDTNVSTKLQIEKLDGVKVWKFKTGALKDIGKVKRTINETLLSYRAWWSIKDRINRDTFDGVIYYSPSIFWGDLVKKIKLRCQCPSYLILRDMFPQWAIDAGLLKSGSLFEKYFRFFEYKSYSQADRIGLMSEKNLEIFRETNQGFPCEVLRNWASLTELVLPDDYISIRKKFNLENKVVYFYGGNIGHAQDMANLIRLARSMMAHENAHFLFVGQGDEVQLINNLAKKWALTNYTYLPSVDQVTFKYILSEVDVGLFSLSARHSSHNFPGKLLGYMVQGLPILGSVNFGNDLLEIVNNSCSGFIHVNGEDEKLYNSALLLLNKDSLRHQYGQNAKTLLEEEFSVKSAAKNIVNSLEATQCV